jgi:hypothetical protein
MPITAFDALAILLKRFSYACRLDELAQFFGRPKECISRIVNELLNYLYNTFAILFRFDTNKLWLQCPFQGNNLTADQSYFNQIMSILRITVEYDFQSIVILFTFLDFKKNLKLYLSCF